MQKNSFFYDFYCFHYGWFTVLCQFLLCSKVTQSYIYILFLTLSSIMFHHKWLDIVPYAMQQDLIGKRILFDRHVNIFWPKEVQLTSLQTPWKGRVYSVVIYTSTCLMPYKFMLLWLLFWITFNICPAPY